MNPDVVTERMHMSIEEEDIELPKTEPEPKKRRIGFVLYEVKDRREFLPGITETNYTTLIVICRTKDSI